MTDMTRRDALKMAIGTTLAMTMGGIVSAAESVAADGKKIRLGVIGVGDRGTTLMNVTLAYPNVEIPALCDINHANLNRRKTRWRNPVENAPKDTSTTPTTIAGCSSATTSTQSSSPRHKNCTPRWRSTA